MLNNFKKYCWRNKWELLILLTLLTIAGLAHGYNMFHYPYYENDEGDYMSQAWSFLTQGKLAPYTYWYDHAPAGWFLIALWVKLTGGFYTFGTAINSGRVLMLILHLLSCLFLFVIAKKITKNWLAGIIAVLVFSLSPLAIYFQRRVLLDNIMIFWVLLSLLLLLKDRFKLSHIIWSSVAFGIAILSKENAIFFIPAFLYIVFVRSQPQHKRFAIINWVIVSGFIVSLYFLYALLRGELFPVGFLGSTTQHVSLLSTLADQINRGSGLPFWNPQSDFYSAFSEWINRDPFLIYLGIISTIIGLLLSVIEKTLRIPVFLVLLFTIFLVRGKLTLDFYIIPIIPLLALTAGVLINLIIKRISFSKQFIYFILSLVSIGLITGIFLYAPHTQYVKDETTSQIEAINWVKQHAKSSDNIIIDDYAYVDLHQARYPGDPVFPNADWFWKVADDPAIRDGKYQNDWRKFTYITLSHEMLKQIKTGSLDLIKSGLDNATLVADFSKNSSAYRDIPQYISTNGDWMSIYKVKDISQIILDRSWSYFKSHFIVSYGQIITPVSDFTSSEMQSEALLQAIFMNDQSTFRGVLAWTQDHLEYRTHDKLFSSLWENTSSLPHLVDSETDSQADQNIALALLFATKIWHNPNYQTQSQAIIQDIWTHEVVKVNGHFYLTEGTSSEGKAESVIYPANLSPAIYRIFAQVDPTHPWLQLTDDSYSLLNKLTSDTTAGTTLPNIYYLLNTRTGMITPMQDSNYLPLKTKAVSDTTLQFNISLDSIWFNSADASNLLLKLKPNLLAGNEADSPKSTQDIQGTGSLSQSSSTVSQAAAIANFIVTDKTKASTIFSKYFDQSFSYSLGNWNNIVNYNDQDWGWWGSALYFGKLPNIEKY